MTSNSHPSATANKAIHYIKGGGVQNKLEPMWVLFSFYIADYFTIDNITAELRLRDNQVLDRETSPVIRLEVIGTDDNVLDPQYTNPPLVVTVAVLDINDNPPRFNQSVYETKIFQVSMFNESIWH